ncbi:TIGR00725 family protein [Candidatus Fermentibacteria bacterium]|nr:TIGR00725 family protein [Candidatus Fermentibacteria bacterium]
MGSRRVQIAVVGSSRPSPRGNELAYECGRLLAQRGAVVICGGLGGVMEAACQGAHDAGGLAVGIVPGSRSDANKWAHAVISPGMGYGRNWAIVHSSDGVLAVEGQIGTLSELCLAAQLSLPIAGLATWNLTELPVRHAATPEEAVAWLMDAIDG